MSLQRLINCQLHVDLTGLNRRTHEATLVKPTGNGAILPQKKANKLKSINFWRQQMHSVYPAAFSIWKYFHAIFEGTNQTKIYFEDGKSTRQTWKITIIRVTRRDQRQRPAHLNLVPWPMSNYWMRWWRKSKHLRPRRGSVKGVHLFRLGVVEFVKCRRLISGDIRCAVACSQRQL